MVISPLLLTGCEDNMSEQSDMFEFMSDTGSWEDYVVPYLPLCSFKHRYSDRDNGRTVLQFVCECGMGASVTLSSWHLAGRHKCKQCSGYHVFEMRYIIENFPKMDSPMFPEWHIEDARVL